MLFCEPDEAKFSSKIYFSPLTKRRPKLRLTCTGCRRLQTSARGSQHILSAAGRNGQHDSPFLCFSFFFPSKTKICLYSFIKSLLSQIWNSTNVIFLILEIFGEKRKKKTKNKKTTLPLLFTGYDFFLWNALYFDF